MQAAKGESLVAMAINMIKSDNDAGLLRVCDGPGPFLARTVRLRHRAVAYLLGMEREYARNEDTLERLQRIFTIIRTSAELWKFDDIADVAEEAEHSIEHVIADKSVPIEEIIGTTLGLIDLLALHNDQAIESRLVE